MPSNRRRILFLLNLFFRFSQRFWWPSTSSTRPLPSLLRRDAFSSRDDPAWLIRLLGTFALPEIGLLASQKMKMLLFLFLAGEVDAVETFSDRPLEFGPFPLPLDLPESSVL